ncbi:MAG TPA: hypothetical protein PK397_07745 [Ignavibacteriaceae bacterium]|nr:hypothetical protein [Ignavibacteriaceae bacterium]
MKNGDWSVHRVPMESGRSQVLRLRRTAAPTKRMFFNLKNGDWSVHRVPMESGRSQVLRLGRTSYPTKRSFNSRQPVFMRP